MDDNIKYVEIGNNYRFFLNWRHQLLAGYLATIAGVVFSVGWCVTNKYYSYIHIPLFVGSVMTFIFWTLEYRIRTLYKICQKAGKKLENGNGLFTDLDNSSDNNDTDCKNKIFTHSRTLNLMFGIFGLALIGLAIFSFYWCGWLG